MKSIIKLLLLVVGVLLAIKLIDELAKGLYIKNRNKYIEVE